MPLSPLPVCLHFLKSLSCLPPSPGCFLTHSLTLLPQLAGVRTKLLGILVVIMPAVVGLHTSRPRLLCYTVSSSQDGASPGLYHIRFPETTATVGHRLTAKTGLF